MRAVATETTRVIFRRLLVTTTMEHCRGWAGPAPGLGLGTGDAGDAGEACSCCLAARRAGYQPPGSAGRAPDPTSLRKSRTYGASSRSYTGHLHIVPARFGPSRPEPM
jgi:hypothetical protein